MSALHPYAPAGHDAAVTGAPVADRRPGTLARVVSVYDPTQTTERIDDESTAGPNDFGVEITAQDGVGPCVTRPCTPSTVASGRRWSRSSAGNSPAETTTEESPPRALGPDGGPTTWRGPRPTRPVRTSCDSRPAGNNRAPSRSRGRFTDESDVLPGAGSCSGTESS